MGEGCGIEERKKSRESEREREMEIDGEAEKGIHSWTRMSSSADKGVIFFRGDKKSKLKEKHRPTHVVFYVSWPLQSSALYTSRVASPASFLLHSPLYPSHYHAYDLILLLLSIHSEKCPPLSHTHICRSILVPSFVFKIWVVLSFRLVREFLKYYT